MHILAGLELFAASNFVFRAADKPLTAPQKPICPPVVRVEYVLCRFGEADCVQQLFASDLAETRQNSCTADQTCARTADSQRPARSVWHKRPVLGDRELTQTVSNLRESDDRSSLTS